MVRFPRIRLVTSNRERITGKSITLTLSVFLLFLLLVFDQQVAMIYLLMLTAYFIWYTFDNKITLPFEKTANGRLFSIIWAVALYAGFLVISTTLSIMFSLEGGQTAFSVIELLATETPVLAGNKFLTFIAWGFVIPIIETVFFFGVLYEGFADKLGRFMRVGSISTDFKLSNLNLWLIIILISSIFTAYHFQARGLTDTTGLFITFLFAFVSLWAVSYFGQTREAVFLHSISNSIAVASRLQIFGFN